MRHFLPLLLVLVAGCTAVSPQPVPVMFGAAVAVDVSRIELAADGADLTVEGAEGAIGPGGATVELVHLEASGTRTEVTADADGSFSAVLPGAPADAAVRLQAYAMGHDATLVDLTSVDGVTMIVADADCAGQIALPTATVSAAVGSEDAVDIPLSHGCAEDVTVTDALVLGNGESITVDTPTPFVVPSDGTATLRLRYRPTSRDPVNDIVLLELEGHRNAAVTVSGAPPSP